GDYFPTILRIASAFELIVVIIRCRPIVSQFFSRLDVAHRDKHDLALQSDIRIAGMIGEDHASLALLLTDGADEQVFCYLDLRWTELLTHFSKSPSMKDMSALHANDFTCMNRLDGKQTSAVNGTGIDGGLRRNVGKWMH